MKPYRGDEKHQNKLMFIYDRSRKLSSNVLTVYEKLIGEITVAFVGLNAIKRSLWLSQSEARTNLSGTVIIDCNRHERELVRLRILFIAPAFKLEWN